MRDCPFCRRRALRQFDMETAWTVSYVPLNPVTPGHRLFVSHDHLQDASADPFATGKVFEAAAAWGELRAESYNLITSVGVEATQSIKHLHIHYVPRFEGDGLHLPWTGQKK